jgi:hypothetical protein
MVADTPPPQFPNKPRCKVLKDNGSHHYIVERDKFPAAPKSISPQVDVWWNRGPRRGFVSPHGRGASNIEETLIIRQENGDGRPADVVIVTQGQAYDQIDAITRAVEQP